MSDPDRQLALAGSFNFRDLGGYPTADGRTVRWRRVFAADGPHALTDDDVTSLADLGIVTVIDLRTSEEASRGRWTDHIGAVTEHHLPLIDVLPSEPDDVDHWSDVEHIAAHYRQLLDRGATSIATALHLLADDEHATLFHCSAGKDRTGVLAAVLLGVLGVSDDDVIADYALSAEAMTRYFAWLQSRAEDRELIDRYRSTILSAEAATMARLLDLVRADFGSFEGYAEFIGAASAVPELRAGLLTPAA